MKTLAAAIALTVAAFAVAPSLAAEMPLEAALQKLSERHGFALQMAEETKGLPVALADDAEGAPADLLERLLRSTSHVLVRDGDRVVRVIVLAPGSAAPDIVAAAEPAPLSAAVAKNQLAEDRSAVRQGLAPDSGRPTGLQAALQGAMQQAERERAVPLFPTAK